MFNKIAKYLLRLLLALLLTALLLPVLLYIPCIQEFLCTRASGYVSQNFGMNLSIGRFRLRFPLKLAIDNSSLSDHTDTLFRCRHLSLDIAFAPLLHRRIVIRQFGITDLKAHYRDTVSGMELQAAAGDLQLTASADWSNSMARIPQIRLADTEIRLALADSSSEVKEEGEALPWTIDLGSAAIDHLRFMMQGSSQESEIKVELPRGRIDSCRIGLSGRQVAVGSITLDRGDYAYLTAPEEISGSTSDRQAKKTESKEPPSVADTTSSPSVQTPSWSIRIGHISLDDNRVLYGRRGVRPKTGFDPSHLVIAPLNATLDSLYNRGGDVRLTIRRLSFSERCGLTVARSGGTIALDSARIRLEHLDMQTARSRIQADLTAGASLLRLDPQAPLRAELAADINTSEIALLLPERIPAALDDRLLRLRLSASGLLGDIKESRLEFDSPDHITLKAEASARALPDIGRCVASVRFEGNLKDLAFLKVLLPDSALQQRLAIPSQIRIRGNATADSGNFATATTLMTGGGSISLQGGLNPKQQSYNAIFRCDSFPLHNFFPHDSLGIADFTIEASGEGFDPLSPSTHAQIETAVRHAHFRGHDFGTIHLQALLREQEFHGRLTDDDPALHLMLDFSGRLTQTEQQADLEGRIDRLDLAALGLLSQKVSAAMQLKGSARISRSGACGGHLALDSIRIRNGRRSETIRPTHLSFRTDSSATGAQVASGDLRMHFSAPAAIDTLLQALTRSGELLSSQLIHARVDTKKLQSRLPHFELSVTAGRHNILSGFLRTQRIGLDSLRIQGGNTAGQPFSLSIRADGVGNDKLRIDTLTASLGQSGQQLDFAVRMANVPGNLDDIAQAALTGHLAGDQAEVELFQQNRQGQTGFRFGIAASWNDSLVRAMLTPSVPLFGFEPWQVNPDNHLIYHFDRRLDADLELTRQNQRFALHAHAGNPAPETLRLDIAQLNLGTLKRIFPTAPPVTGSLDASVSATLSTDSLALQGTLALARLAYDRQPVGNVDLALGYTRGKLHRATASLSLDSTEVMTLHGRYDESDSLPLDLSASLRSLPMQPFNAFLPQDLIHLSGTLGARIHAAGPLRQPLLDGGFALHRTAIRIPMIGSSFRISDDTVRLDRNRLRFNGFALYAPNNHPLTIDGTIDLNDLSRMQTDLAFHAADFQMVQVARQARTPVYGKAYLDLDASARGPLDKLRIRGNVALLGGTEISYVMQDSPMDIKERPQNIMQFVSFDQLDNREEELPAPDLQIGGLDMLINVDINNDVQAGVDLSTDGNNRIDLQGGGNLTYTMNPLGDVRLSGKYILSGGYVRYNPPVIAQKTFKITPDSYVEWIGDPMDPSFNITAVETVRANVSSDGQESHPVNFDISINIRNSLNDLEISFGLAAPEDLTMQNQLNSLTAEQRASQAMNLLIYNSYTGPGTTAKVSSENPLNSFIQKELNQWAQNNLKGVDLSFGIDSYGEDDPNGQRTDYSFRLSKSLFSNRIRAVIGGKFSSDADPSQNLKENLIDDISLEYMLTKRDNMYLRLFRHTGYESILEGEITETGVGFVIRKKISRLGDLFRPTRPKNPKTLKTSGKSRQSEPNRSKSPAPATTPSLPKKHPVRPDPQSPATPSRQPVFETAAPTKNQKQ